MPAASEHTPTHVNLTCSQFHLNMLWNSLSLHLKLLLNSLSRRVKSVIVTPHANVGSVTVQRVYVKQSRASSGVGLKEGWGVKRGVGWGRGGGRMGASEAGEVYEKFLSSSSSVTATAINKLIILSLLKGRLAL